MKTVTLESAREDLDHLGQNNGPGRQNALALLVPGDGQSVYEPRLAKAS